MKNFPLQDALEVRNQDIISELLPPLVNSSTQLTIGIEGTMSSGKTSLVTHLAQALKHEGKTIYAYKLPSDNRGANTNAHEIGFRDAWRSGNNVPLLQAEQVHSLDLVLQSLRSKKITSHDICIINEAAWIAGEAAKVHSFMNEFNDIGCHLIIDSLSLDYRSQRIPATEAFAQRANAVYILQAFDSFNSWGWSTTNMRGVPVNLDGTLPTHIRNERGENVVLEDPHYYRMLANHDKKQLHALIQQFKESEYGESLINYAAEHFGNDMIFLPSHPDDDLVVISVIRYAPTCSKTFQGIYALAGFNFGNEFLSTDKLHPKKLQIAPVVSPIVRNTIVNH